MHKLAFFIIVLTWFGFVPAQAQSDGCVAAAGPPIEIGAVFPAANLFATEAADYYRGVQAMVAAINACGGANGQPVELRYEPASNRESAEAAVNKLDVPLVIGSGSAIVRDVLVQASAQGNFVYWEVTEPLDDMQQRAFSPRPNSYQLGALAADFINNEIGVLLEGEPPRLAIVYEDLPPAAAITTGLNDSLLVTPMINQRYVQSSGYDLAVKMREMAINVVVVNTFENQADRLWYQMRQADANVKAWIQVGGDRYRRNVCPRFGNVDGLISISATGPVAETYRQTIADPVYDQYRAAYETLFGEAPGERADLSASGTYLLLHDVLPQAASFSSDAIQTAITAASGTGFLGEGLQFSGGINQAAQVVVQQAQVDQFCSLMPGGLGTCSAPLQSFPTWRERAVAAEAAACRYW